MQTILTKLEGHQSLTQNEQDLVLEWLNAATFVLRGVVACPTAPAVLRIAQASNLLQALGTK